MDKKKTKQNEKKESDQKVEELEGKYKRALADYQNLEKRVAEERSSLIRKANKQLLLRLLPILDTLLLASNHLKDEGLTLSIKQFFDVLRNEGVEKIETAGRDFDPKTMECVDTTLGEKNKVISEIRVGFTLFGEVLRPAQVTVGKTEIEEKEESLTKEQLQKGDYM